MWKELLWCVLHMWANVSMCVHMWAGVCTCGRVCICLCVRACVFVFMLFGWEVGGYEGPKGDHISSLGAVQDRLWALSDRFQTISVYSPQHHLFTTQPLCFWIDICTLFRATQIISSAKTVTLTQRSRGPCPSSGLENVQLHRTPTQDTLLM